MSPRTLPLPLAIALLAVAASVAAGIIAGLPIGLMAAAGLVLALVIGLLWASLQHLSGEVELTLEEALSLAAPTIEEERKRAVLRTLKDLEYERSVGKISDQDYRELSQRYRDEAKQLIVAVDDTLEPMRKRAEKRLAEFEANLPPASAPQGSAEDKDDESVPISQRPTIVGKVPDSGRDEAALPNEEGPNEEGQRDDSGEPEEAGEATTKETSS